MSGILIESDQKSIIIRQYIYRKQIKVSLLSTIFTKLTKKALNWLLFTDFEKNTQFNAFLGIFICNASL